MLIDFLFNSKFYKFIILMNNIFSSIAFWIFICFSISIFIRITFLKAKSLKTLNNSFNRIEIIAFIFTFISNILILSVLNILTQFYLVWVSGSTLVLLNIIFIITKTKYFDIIVIFNKIIAVFFLVAFAPIIFILILQTIVKTKHHLFYLILWVFSYVALIGTIIINNNTIELKQIFRRLFFGFILILLILILNFQFIENTKDIKLSTIFSNIFMFILLWIWGWHVVLMKSNDSEVQNEKQSEENLKFFVLAIKNDTLIMNKTIKYTTIILNGYKQVLTI
ncbi:hypothetical protein [Spiroplasma endosymbiont of Glossina fuscipes fuscipes]|uniref:hypothetical protein n=1 Tax=Spiroplasma endosymbiont of Glossina fuscipes fuscipes TaxID=2004463 RepID=UPI003C75A03C